MPNYAWTTGKPLPVVDNGSTIEGWNLCQKLPHTKIFEGVTGLTFRGCNLINCDVPPDATVIDCNRGQMEWCGNANPKLVERGILAACPEVCSHVNGTDRVSIDGVLVETLYQYENKAVS
jgi:hypothetical protein